jgi:hypothetical protein
VPAASAPTAAVSAAAAPAAAELPPPVEAPPGVDLRDFRVVSLAIGGAVDEENIVLQPRAQFGPREAFYASLVSFGGTGLILRATLKTEAGELVAQSEQVLEGDGARVSTFRLQNPQRWPVGTYRMEFAIADHLVDAKGIEVR